MDVSVIIVNYNTLKLTDDCINSVLQLTSDVEFEIILVDNASSDGSREHFSMDNRIKYIYSDVNLGFGKGNNLGASCACGKYLFFLNSDTLLLNNAIKIFFDYMEGASETIACVGCLLQDRNGFPMHSYAKLPDFMFYIKRYLFSAIRLGHKFTNKFYSPVKNAKYPLSVGYITGADIFMKNDVAKRHGLFDSDFFMYCEESEMQFRYTKEGYESVIIDTPKILHLEGASNRGTERYALNKDLIKLESDYLYCNKTMSPIKVHLIGACRLLTIPKILLNSSPWSYKKEIIKSYFNKL